MKQLIESNKIINQNQIHLNLRMRVIKKIKYQEESSQKLIKKIVIEMILILIIQVPMLILIYLKKKIGPKLRRE